MAGRNAGLAEEFLEKRVHGLEAVGVAGIIAQQDIMLQKENVVFPAVEENQPVLAKLVKRNEIFAKQGAAGFCDDDVLLVADKLRHLLYYAATCTPPLGLHHLHTCFN